MMIVIELFGHILFDTCLQNQYISLCLYSTFIMSTDLCRRSVTTCALNITVCCRSVSKDPKGTLSFTIYEGIYGCDVSTLILITLCRNVRKNQIIFQWFIYKYTTSALHVNFPSIVMWQPSQPASLSAAGLTLWPSWLECSRRWVCYLPRFETQWGCWCRDVTLRARPQAWVKPSALIVHSEPTYCHVFGLAWMAGCQPGVSGAIAEGRNVKKPAGLLASRQRVWPFGRIG